ncbi:MAG: TIR domain-containing protein [Methanotrichaceae archaeon]|nr:TIR domain-containing protein [Methanotrichaceae archaeon]
MRGLTWLHLSDWHQKGKDFDRQVVRDALINDIERRVVISPDLAEIDFIVFSGDVAHSGKAEEYEAAAEQLFGPLLKAAGVIPQRLFIVPGNHDLDRTTFELLPAALLKPLGSDSEVQRWLINDEERSLLLRPFKAFASFVSNYTGQEQPHYASIRKWQIGGKNIALLGLNSAWMCGRNSANNDRGVVLLGESQIHDPLKEISNSDIKIAVLHHPFDWLAQFDCDHVEGRLMRQCDFILCGHQHKPQATVIKSTLGDCTVIPAGGSYNRRKVEDPFYVNAYNIVHLDFESGKLVVFLRRWSDPRNEWIEDTDSHPGGNFEFHLLSVTSDHLPPLSDYQKRASRENANQQTIEIPETDISVGIKYDVFISYAHTSAEKVEKIAGRLNEEEGFEVWLDKWSLIPGNPSWQHELARGLDQSKSCVVCIGEEKPSGWQKEEIQRALNIQAGERMSFRVIPLLLPGSKPEHLVDFLNNRSWVDFRDDSKLDDGFYRLVCGIRGVPPGRGPSNRKITKNNSEAYEIEKKLKMLSDYREKGLICEEIHLEYQRRALDLYLFI